MKNKIVVLIILFLMPFIVKANSISLVCNSDVVKNTNLNCTIKGKSSELVTAVSAKVRTGSNISISSFVPDTTWQGDGEGGNIDLYTASDISGDFVIGTINFKVDSIKEGGNSTITIDSVFFYDEDGLEKSISPITKNIRIASTINNLSSLTLSSGNLNPTFNSEVTDYSTNIDASSVTINAKAESSYSTISGNIGKVDLNYGNNTFRVIVTSESDTSKTYTINIVRPKNNVDANTDQTTNTSTNDNVSKSNNTYLKNISLSDGNINFDKNITEYQTNVSYDITNVEVTAVPEDSKSIVEITGNNNLIVGNNEIKIKVTAEDNSSKIYTINIERKEENYILSNNNNISNIIIEGYNFYFDASKYEYTLSIHNEKKLSIDVILEDQKASYAIDGNDNLKNNSVIKIIVTAEDGTNKTYQINIKSNDKLIKTIFIIIITVLILINILRILIKCIKNIKIK